MVEIRRSPRTNPDRGQQAYQQGQGLDFSAIGAGFAAIAGAFDERRRDDQRFELQQRLLTETNNFQADLEARRTNPEVDPYTFAETTGEEYNQRMTDIINEYVGYDDDLVDDFRLGLGRLSNSLAGSALSYQQEALNTRAVSRGQKVVDEATRLVTTDPSSFQETRDFAIDTIRNSPHLTEAQRIEFEDTLQAVRTVAAERMLLDSPQYIIEQLDPTGLFAQKEAAKKARAVGISGVTEGDRPARVINYEARESSGLDKVPDSIKTLGQLRAFQLTLNDANESRIGRRGSSAVGLYQIVGTTLEQYAKELYGDAWEERPFDIATQDALAKAIFEDAIASPEQLKATWVSLTLAEARRLVDAPWEEARVLIAKKESGADLAETIAPESDIETFDPGPSTANQTEFTQSPDAPGLEQLAFDPSDPVLAELTGPEAQSILRRAYQAAQTEQTSNRAAVRVRIENAKAEALSNGGKVTDMPSPAEIIEAYGEDEGPQIIAEIQGIQRMAGFMQDWTLADAATLEQEVEALRPRAGDPAFAVKDEIYRSAVEAAQSIQAARQKDPAQYVINNNPAAAAAIAEGDTRKYVEVQRATQKRLGIEQRNLWPDEYVAQQKKAYETYSADQREAWLREHLLPMRGSEMNTFIDKLEGSQAYYEAQMAQLIMTQYPASLGERMLPIMLQGQTRINEDPARRPSRDTVLNEFRGTIFEGITELGGEASRTYQNLAAAIYVARGGDPDLNDSSLYRESVREAFGGVAEDSNTGWWRAGKNGVPDITVLPPQVTRQEFQRFLDKITTDDLQDMALNGGVFYGTGERVQASDVAEEGTLVMVSPGVYTIKFRQSGSRVEGAVGRDGRPVRLRIPQVRVKRFLQQLPKPPARTTSPIPNYGPIVP